MESTGRRFRLITMHPARPLQVTINKHSDPELFWAARGAGAGAGAASRTKFPTPTCPLPPPQPTPAIKPHARPLKQPMPCKRHAGHPSRPSAINAYLRSGWLAHA